MASANASSVSFVSVSVGSISSASSTSSGKYTVGGWNPWSSSRLARSSVLIPSSRFIGAPESTNSWPQSLPYASGSRSEEHTSELQSRQYLVCRLLLEKKKKERTKVSRVAT